MFTMQIILLRLIVYVCWWYIWDIAYILKWLAYKGNRTLMHFIVTWPLITYKMYYYFSSSYTFFDLDFIDFCNVMLVLCVYFRYMLIKNLCASKWWNSAEKERKGKKGKIRLKSQKSVGSKSQWIQTYPRRTYSSKLSFIYLVLFFYLSSLRNKSKNKV